MHRFPIYIIFKYTIILIYSYNKIVPFSILFTVVCIIIFDEKDHMKRC